MSSPEDLQDEVAEMIADCWGRSVIEPDRELAQQIIDRVRGIPIAYLVAERRGRADDVHSGWLIGDESGDPGE